MPGIVGITVHYTATAPGATVEAIARGQLDRVADPQTGRKFPAIAYTLVVPEDGSIAWCHDLNVRCWHSGAWGRNDHYIGLCWIGNHTPNDAQIAAMRYAIREWIPAQLGRPLGIVEGHRDAMSTLCPGPTWNEWKGRL